MRGSAACGGLRAIGTGMDYRRKPWTLRAAARAVAGAIGPTDFVDWLLVKNVVALT